MYISFGEAETFLRNCKDAVIITHRNPDGDCIGAGFGLKDILQQLGIRSRVVCHDDFPERFDFLTNVGAGEDFEPQTVIAVDVADPSLMGKYQEIYGKRVQLCIDHHVSNKNYAEKTLLRADASATCEVIYQLAESMGLDISRHCAMCLYTGIATDTGCFRFDCTTYRTHEAVADIMKKFDINFARINRYMFDVKSEGRIKLESMLNGMMELYLGGKLCIIAVTNEIMEKVGIDSSELEGFANLTLQLEKTEIGIFIRERENDFKCSFRSSGDINVSEICQQLGGGGHAKASGCNMAGTLDEVKTKMIETVREALC
ncbi:MAG: bifunctional oligoribonuclease/PAP phosphatase NrnA [Ruminococcus sp.]|nr:bifunctional oligoribonuclease/PAP phosphatase NrnA [Ruminococcus sp.]